ncbi:hypothetical protein [Daejeonella lutea]|uniref:Uncharacterized protein n=1 Tax=Daejeonella lutea TaxID=572036 RepID=A0A1T5EUH6_9SPHI|nr:hypothetical protein [Daejeonella lutea]SKB87597.1 hypothetical protein SAMN05661099_3228 [Daejeonella lutea]
MKKTCFLLLLIFSLTKLQGQILNDSLEYRIRPDSLKTGELHLSVHNFNYMRNYEYFNKIQDGHTLFGGQLEPQLLYYAHPRLSISAGVHLRKDFGGRGIYRTFPLFSVKYQKHNTTLINGVLEGNIHHRMIEPIYDFEKKITEPVEYGTQFIIENKSFFLDAFINWKRMIYKPSPDQEQILGGASMAISLVDNTKLSLSIPVQLTVFHQGGQIDVTNVPLQTLVNSALGFKLKIPLQGFVNAFRSENYYTHFRDLSFTSVQAFSTGGGWFLNSGIDTKYGSLLGTYWNADKFISTQGMPIYQSVSQHIKHAGYTEAHRRLLMIRYSYQKRLIPNLYLDFRFEPLMDLNRPKGKKKIEFSNSSFLVYRQEFRLLKKSNR